MLITDGKDGENGWIDGWMGGSRTTRAVMLRKTGRYPHLSNATEKDLSGPPRAGRKGFRIEVCYWACAATHAALRKEGGKKQRELLYLPLP